MKIIEKIIADMEDEICGVKHYAKMAIEIKPDSIASAEMLYDMSKEEEKHFNNLHTIAEKLIADYRAKNGEPPADMLAVYNYEHKKSIDRMAEAKRYQDMYKA